MTRRAFVSVPEKCWSASLSLRGRVPLDRGERLFRELLQHVGIEWHQNVYTLFCLENALGSRPSSLSESGL